MEHFSLVRRIEQNSGKNICNKIVNEENEWDQIADTVEGPIERVMRKEIMEAFKHFMIRKAPVPSDIYAEMILTSGNVGIRVLMELYQRILDGKGLPADWATSVEIPIFKGKGDMNCGIKLLEHVKEMVKKVLEI